MDFKYQVPVLFSFIYRYCIYCKTVFLLMPSPVQRKELTLLVPVIVLASKTSYNDRCYLWGFFETSYLINVGETDLSPAWAASTDSALRMTSRLRGMQPRGSSACTSCMRTFWKSTKRDLCVSSRNRDLLLHTGFLNTNFLW